MRKVDVKCKKWTRNVKRGREYSKSGRKMRKVDVNMHITHLPIIDGMEKINDSVFNFRLTEGYSAETSGGLFLMMAPDKVEAFQSELLNSYGQQSWTVGELLPGKAGERKVIFGENDDHRSVEIINVSESFLVDE